ncbi:MAG: ABC transporter ATP-binding protein [Akkermansiaceae bacterium]|nr:ABC transporter ATP-binding protein [Akkermansiaceae bacterium]
MPLCILPIRVITRRLKKRARKLQSEVGDVAAYVTDNLQAPREIRAFNLEEQQVDGLRGKIASLLKWQMKVIKYEKTASPLVEIVAAFGIAATVIYAGRVNIQLETMIPLLMALYVCYEPVKRLSGLATRWKRMEASLERIEDLLHIEPEVEDPEDPVELAEVRGAVSFEHVSFAYEEEDILREVEVEIGPGEVVGIVGPSGAGKTTFVNLLLRFYDTTRGTVKIDGHDVRKVRQAALRQAIAFVPQEPLLFNATARDNILVGRPDAGEDEIIEAARRARAHDFITAMEGGYDTMMGEKGTRLSGGQRQRIALARAFLKNAPILVLDEGTSALDSENEALIQEELMGYVQGKTVFIIAHRFATLEIVDRILVFHQGNLVGDGSNEELLERCSLYRDLRELQMFG